MLGRYGNGTHLKQKKKINVKEQNKTLETRIVRMYPCVFYRVGTQLCNKKCPEKIEYYLSV